MNIEQVNAFLSIVRLGSFSKAANHLFISQSTISQRINSIESEYGLKLIKRTRGGKGIHLTHEGELFYQIALDYETLGTKVKDIKSNKFKNTLSVGSVDSVNNYILNHMYTNFLKNHPDIFLETHSYQSNDIYRIVSERKIDLGFSLKNRIIKNIKTEEFLNEQMVLITNTFNDKYNIIKNNLLSPKKQILINWGQEYGIWHEKHWGSMQNTLAQVDTVKMLEYMLVKFNSWAIAPVSVARELKRKKRVNMFLLYDPPPNRVCYVVYKKEIKDLKPAINKFLDLKDKIANFAKPFDIV